MNEIVREPNMNIIARKPRPMGGQPDTMFQTEFIVVDRGENHGMRYVSATANAYSLSMGE